MNLDYFYCPPENIKDDQVVVEGEEFAHLTHVMRKREGDMIRVVNGKGIAYDVELVSLKKKAAEGKIRESYVHHNEARQQITVAVGLLKNPHRFDFLIEKVTELGVTTIIPLTTSRTIPSHTKIERWQKLALSAMKQSCRSFLPAISEAMALEELLRTSERYSRKILFHEKAEHDFTKEPNAADSTLLLIGPEGGFSDEEVDLCVQKGFLACSLGERRLRTETAAIVGAAMAMLKG
ncbi:MAG: 16S rRNA (uracil(1498)-N(3))-methyltransferase [Bacteroidetes bacterium]|nr:MAG: 16S rRNA (uracil(1498)-N(3))-methyltransferase [Bacteroidota bacterium]